MSIIESIENIENWFKIENRFHGDLNPPAESDSITLINSVFGPSVDKDVILFYKRHDGFPDWMVFRDEWHIMSLELVQEIYKENLDLFDNIIAADPWEFNWFPFASNGSGDYMFIDLESQKVYIYYHEGGEKSSNPAYIRFEDYINSVSIDFTQQKYTFSNEDGLLYKG